MKCEICEIKHLGKRTRKRKKIPIMSNNRAKVTILGRKVKKKFKKTKQRRNNGYIFISEFLFPLTIFYL